MDQPALIVELQRHHRTPHEHYVFVRSPVHIGRGPRNELRLDHAFVSHAHGVLHFDASGVDFVDLGSTNGSFLDGVRLESHRFASVHVGASLAVGPARLRARLDLPPLRRKTELDRSAPQYEGTVTCVNDDDARSAVLARLARSFVDLARNQRRWRAWLGLATPAQSAMHAPEDAAALLSYLLSPGQEPARLAELNAACEELLRNERALAHALDVTDRDLSTRSRAH